MIDKIFNEDCLEGLERLGDNSVDLIITDPPYCVGTTSNGIKGSFLDNNLIAPFFKQLFRECQRVLKQGGRCTYTPIGGRILSCIHCSINTLSSET